MQDNNTPQPVPETPTPITPPPIEAPVTPTPAFAPAPTPIPPTPTPAPVGPTPVGTPPPAVAQPLSAVPSPVAPITPKKGIPKIVKIIIGIVAGLIVLVIIGIVALFLIINLGTQAPVNVSNKFFDDLQANQPTAAYDLTSADFKGSATETQLADLFTQVSPLMTGNEKVIGKRIESNNGVSQAAVAYSVENDGTTRYARIVLKETDSKWEVLNFKTSSTVLDATIE